jgi:PAP2 superfamily
VSGHEGKGSDAGGLTRRKFLSGLSRVAAGTAALGVTGPAVLAGLGSSVPRPASSFGAQVPTAWFDLALDLVRLTPGFSPPVVARVFGYAGVTLYEALVPGMPGYLSLSGRLKDLGAGPGPSDPAHHWPTVANAALASILRSQFPTATIESKAAMDALEESLADIFRTTVPPGIYRRSVDRGRGIASHIFEWSKFDGGHEGYLHNFPPYTPPVGPGLWVPTPPGFLPALQPFWGSNRPFALPSGAECDPGPPLAYSEEPSSAFYAETLECYEVVTNLSPEQRVIALFWSDDPGITCTPPGHSISILTQVVRGHGCTLDVAAEAYARVGMAVADAFVSCWNTKYRYNLLRPVTYIRHLIDPSWSSLLVTPPFPEYTSGHSVQSGAAAQVLTDLFGTVAFTDHTHDDRGLTPRSFGSFFEAAEEAALSRLYGGIHFRTAIVLGLDQGRCVGQHVSDLPFRA